MRARVPLTSLSGAGRCSGGGAAQFCIPRAAHGAGLEGCQPFTRVLLCVPAGAVRALERLSSMSRARVGAEKREAAQLRSSSVCTSSDEECIALSLDGVRPGEALTAASSAASRLHETLHEELAAHEGLAAHEASPTFARVELKGEATRGDLATFGERSPTPAPLVGLVALCSRCGVRGS